MALTFSEKIENLDSLPHFTLPALDDKKISPSIVSKGKPIWIMFICNHCPYVKAIESRIIKTAQELQTLGFDVYAICSNDSADYPEDSFENLKKNWIEKKFSFSYLHDENQIVAKLFGAVCTPDFYLFDKEHKLKYRGRLDDNWKKADEVKTPELLNAAKKILVHEPIKGIVPSMGCSIKWK